MSKKPQLYLGNLGGEEGNAFVILGNVLHCYDHGAFALTQKVTKAIVAQQKAAQNGK